MNMIKIRGHHLLCIPRFYSGGYNKEFAENMKYICMQIRKNPDVKIIGCQPQKDHMIQGWRNFEESAKPDLFLKRENVVDDWVSVTNAEAFEVVKEVFEKDSMLISPSSAAVYASMKKYKIDSGYVVGIFADDGRKFKSIYSKQNVMTEEEFDQALKNAKHMSEIAYM